MKIKAITTAFALSAGLVFSGSALAGNHGQYADHGSSGHGMDHGSKNGHSGHMMNDENMGNHGGQMREVMGQGSVNKVMGNHGMVNINHAPIPELNWPQMNMNFKTQKGVSLEGIEPGQEVEFTLLVDDDNNYVIKDIVVK